MKKRIKIDHLSTLCVGLDIGSRNNYITALDFDSNRLINMQYVPNVIRGVEVMESLILAVLQTNPYHVKVFCLNPKEIANYKKSFTGLGKNDGLDSFIDVDYVRIGRIAIELWRGAQFSLDISPNCFQQTLYYLFLFKQRTYDSPYSILFWR